MKLFAERKINTEALISHELPLERFEEGFRATRSGEAIKVLLTPEAR